MTHFYVVFFVANVAWIIGVIGVVAWLNARQHRLGTLRAGAPMHPSRKVEAAGFADAANLASAGAATLHDPASLPLPQSGRFPYRVRQWAAPCVEGQTPEIGDFVSVECYELHSGGVSFYSIVPFDSEHLIVSLGNRDNMFFTLSRIINRLVVRDRGSTKYLLECQFICRQQIDTWRWAEALKATGANHDARNT